MSSKSEGRHEFKGCGSLILFMGLLTASCVPLFVFDVQDPTNAGFEGIGHLLRDEPRVKVLVVHGIGHHPPTYAQELLENVEKELSLKKGPTLPLIDTIRNPDDSSQQGNYGSVTEYDYSAADGHMLSFYVLTWSPLTDPIKQEYLGYDYDNDKYTSPRVWFNKSLKDELIDQSLSDAVLYAGRFRHEMQFSVQQAICLMMEGHKVEANTCMLPTSSDDDNQERIVIITSSLGSMMVYQTIEAFHDETHPAAKRNQIYAKSAEQFAANTEIVYMLANQLPLLRLADLNDFSETLDKKHPHKKLHESLERFLDLRKARRAQRNQGERVLPIVAFSDPNDLLSYSIRPSYTKQNPEHRGDVRFVNILLSIEKSAIFGIFANPLAAHTGHYHSTKVINMISCGYRIQTPC